MSAAGNRAALVANARAQRQQRRAAGKRARVRRQRLPQQLEPTAISRSYFGALREVVTRARALVEQHLVKQVPELVKRANAGGAVHAQVTAAVGRARASWGSDWPPGRTAGLALQYARRLSDFQRQQLMKQLVAGLGAEPVLRDRHAPAKLSAFAAEAASKLRAIVEAYFAQVEGRALTVLRPHARVDRADDQGEEDDPEDYILEAHVSVDDFVLELGRRGDAAEGNTAQLSLLSTRGLFADLNESRQKELGLDQYTWTTMGDDLVRPEHAALNGSVQSWDDPPDIGNPGDPPNCRCIANPVLDQLQDELGV